jgi:hypothetical protein
MDDKILKGMNKMNNDRFLARGKTANGKWVYGAYHKHLPYTPSPLRDQKEEEKKEKDYRHIIIQDDFSDWNMPRGIICIEVLPETVGMCTGKTDENKRLIYEGDIVITPFKRTMLVKWSQRKAAYIYLHKSGVENNIGDYKVKIIGDIHDKTELLEEK